VPAAVIASFAVKVVAALALNAAELTIPTVVPAPDVTDTADCLLDPPLSVALPRPMALPATSVSAEVPLPASFDVNKTPVVPSLIDPPVLVIVTAPAAVCVLLPARPSVMSPVALAT
jgi:hypothetical protein